MFTSERTKQVVKRQSGRLDLGLSSDSTTVPPSGPLPYDITIQSTQMLFGKNNNNWIVVTGRFKYNTSIFIKKKKKFHT